MGAACIALAAVAFTAFDGAPAEAGGCGRGVEFSVDNPPGACWRPFSTDSPFNRGLPSDPQQTNDSPLLGSALAGFGAAPLFEVGTADTVDDFGHPIYFSGPKDPVFKIRCTEFGSSCPVSSHRVQIPGKARPAGGSDAHMAVIDQAGGWEYDFWAVADRDPASAGKPGVLTVGWAGRTRIARKGSRGLNSAATASGFALSAGVIRPAELRAGEIDHALSIGVPCTNGHAVWPAEGNPGRSCSALGVSNATAPAMGQHFYLAMTNQEIDALSVPRWQRTILTAIARYGMFVGDTGGNAWGIALESGTSFTSLGRPDPWVKLAKQLGVPSFPLDDGTSRYVFDLRDSIEWAGRLRVAAPCVSQGKC